MSPGMCACRDTDPACPRILGAPRGRVSICSVPGAVVMISPGVTATTSGVDPTDGVNGCDGGTALDRRNAPHCRGAGTNSGMGQRVCALSLEQASGGSGVDLDTDLEVYLPLSGLWKTIQMDQLRIKGHQLMEAGVE